MTEIRDEFVHPGPQPNGLQAADDGLWVIDQVDNHLYKLDYETGETLEKLPTETEHSSGVTLGGGHLWVASTFTLELVQCNMDGSSVTSYWHEDNWKRLDRVHELASEKGVAVPLVALAWVLRNPELDVYALVGARTPGEVKANAEVFDLKLSTEEADWLDLRRDDR